MSGTRGRRGRIVAMGFGLALALLLLAAGEAKAAKYSVAQCGWHVGADADWADTTGGAKFRPDSYCATPAGADPFDGAHLKSFTRDGQPTVSGTRFARWRWQAPPATAITRVSGTWWHALHDGIEQRIGVAPRAAASTSSPRRRRPTPPRATSSPASPAAPPALEDRLLCARAESKSCSLEPGSWSALRALTITLEDDAVPAAALGGELVGRRLAPRHPGPAGLRAPTPAAGCASAKRCSTARGSRLTEYPCAKAS